MTILTPEWTVVYGGVTVGGSSGREIIRFQRIDKKFESATFEVEFVIHKTAEGTFGTEIDTIEAIFRKPFQDLVVTLGSTDTFKFKQSDNTGLEVKSEIFKPGEPYDSGRSRLYGVRISCELPANTGGESFVGLREKSVNVEYSQSRRRTVTITGVFTAAGSTAARAQYAAQLSALEGAVKSALGITSWDVLDEPTTQESYHDQTLNFTRRYKEILFSQAGSADDSAIVDQHLFINVTTEAPGDTPIASRLKTVEARYDASIDFAVTTDLKGKYENTIRQWMIQKAVAAAGGGTSAVVQDAPEYDFDDNRISSRMRLEVVNKSAVLESEISVEDDEDFGFVHVHAWTGRRNTKYEYQGPGDKRRTVASRIVLIGSVYVSPTESASVDSLLKAVGVFALVPDVGMTVRHLRGTPKMSYKRIGQGSGIGGAGMIDVTEITQTDYFYLFEPVGISGPANIPSGQNPGAPANSAQGQAP